MENRKDLIKKFRAEVCGGKHPNRTTLLAYAFLRGVPYVAVERVINEDHPSFGEGRNSFLRFLAAYVVTRICDIQFSGKTPSSFRRDGNEEKVKEYNEFSTLLVAEVNAWIREKYKAESKQEAAE
jgi:hypothetical protein